jgi:hypothetical protein
MNQASETLKSDPETLDKAIAAVPSCALTEEGLRAQRARMKALGPSVSYFKRDEDRVTIDFKPDYDPALLDETLAVERECCPFFRFDLDAASRRLTVSVNDPDHRAGLDALTQALGPPAPRVGSRRSEPSRRERVRGPART